MHVVLVLLALLGVAAVWWWRVRAARGAAGGAGKASDIRVATRRLMQGPQTAHPADSVDDPRLAAAGIVVAVATMDGPISLAEIDRMKRAAEETFHVSEREALDILSFARWVAGECTSNAEAVRRLSRALMKSAGSEVGPDLVRMIHEVATADGGELGDEEFEAIDAVRRNLGMEAAGRRTG